MLGWRYKPHKAKKTTNQKKKPTQKATTTKGMKLEKEGELVKACREEVRIINQTNGERAGVQRE